MKAKVLSVERYLNIYRNADGEYEQHILLDMPLEEITKVAVPVQDDPNLYTGCILSEMQVKQMSAILKENVTLDFATFYYVLECVGIYDWNA